MPPPSSIDLTLVLSSSNLSFTSLIFSIRFFFSLSDLSSIVVMLYGLTGQGRAGVLAHTGKQVSPSWSTRPWCCPHVRSASNPPECLIKKDSTFPVELPCLTFICLSLRFSYIMRSRFSRRLMSSGKRSSLLISYHTDLINIFFSSLFWML